MCLEEAGMAWAAAWHGNPVKENQEQVCSLSIWFLCYIRSIWACVKSHMLFYYIFNSLFISWLCSIARSDYLLCYLFNSFSAICLFLSRFTLYILSEQTICRIAKSVDWQFVGKQAGRHQHSVRCSSQLVIKFWANAYTGSTLLNSEQMHIHVPHYWIHMNTPCYYDLY